MSVQARGAGGWFGRVAVDESGDAGAAPQDADGAVEPPGAGFEGELVNWADAVGRADPDVFPLAPGLEVLVDVAREADEPAVGGGFQRVGRGVAFGAESARGGDVLAVGRAEEGGIR